MTSWCFVKHTDTGGWSNYYGPFKNSKTARKFIDKHQPGLPENHSLSFDMLLPPDQFSLSL